MKKLCTIGYEGATIDAVMDALTSAGVNLLVDIRAVASSRRPGFSKTQLAAHLEEGGIEYRQLRALGTPASGRAAARAGHHGEMRRIYGKHLATIDAQSALHELSEWIASGRRACLLCFEADPEHCHRTIVAEALAKGHAIRVEHLRPEAG